MNTLEEGMSQKKHEGESEIAVPHSDRTSPHKDPSIHKLTRRTSDIQSTSLPTSHHKSMFALRQASHLLTRRTFSTTTRIMSQKHEWMVILPDNTGALEKRMAVRQCVLIRILTDR